MRGTDCVGQNAAGEAVVKVPTILIPISLLTVGWMVLFSTIQHPEAGLGFFFCCVLGTIVYRLCIR